MGAIFQLRRKQNGTENMERAFRKRRKSQRNSLSEPQMDLISWHEKCQSEGLTGIQEEYIIRCAERFDRTMKNYCF